MKKILLLFIILLSACSNSNHASQSNINSQENQFETVPVKNNINGVTIDDSSVNTRNIENYLFRNDTVYVDLRPYSEVAREGHIAGFSFYPFYDFIASIENSKDYNKNPMDNRLFKMINEMGKIGQIGNFVPNYEESEFVLNELFPKDKNIFAISIEGSECIYFLNLLIQYGYDSAKLYNIGGFSIASCLENIAYISVENPKYLVPGNPLLNTVGNNETFDFMKDLTPIN